MASVTLFKRHPIYNVLVGWDGTIIGASGAVLKPYERNNGYLQISYGNSKSRIRWCKPVHRLVADVFCEKPSDVQVEVNHKDSNRKNNTARNLEWCSREENVKHSVVFGRKNSLVGEKNIKAKLTTADVAEIRGLVVQRGEAPWNAYGICRSSFWRIRADKAWKGVSK